MIPCTACGQALYPLERMTLNSKVFHKQGCARCSTCNTNLNISNFAVVGDKLFCKTHYLANFQRSGGRYSFDGAEKALQTPTKEVRMPSIKAEQPKNTPTPVVQRVAPNSQAASTPNRLSAFLASTVTTEPSSASKPAAPSPIKAPATPAPVSSVQKTIAPASVSSAQKTTAPVSQSGAPVSTNKLAAFLANPTTTASAASATPVRQDVKSTPTENHRSNHASVASKPVEASSSSVRPVSLKERMEAYTAEVSGVKKPVETKPVASSQLPPLPKKDKALEAQHRTFPEDKDASRKVSIVTPEQSKQSETPTRAVVQSENRLSAFLKQVEPLPTPSATSSAAGASTAASWEENRRKNARDCDEDDAPTRPRPLSLKERIAAYSSEATRADQQPTKPAPPLPPAKPSYDKVLSMSPKKQSSSASIFSSRSDSATTKSSTPSSPTRTGSGESRPMSLKERIASYQARASGLGNGRFRSPTRKSSGGGDKSMTRESPTKKPGFRSRFPFLKSPVHASPNVKTSELARIAVKVCNEGLAQLTRTSMKNPDADPKLVAVVAELKIALESSLKQVRLLETEAHQRAIPH